MEETIVLHRCGQCNEVFETEETYLNHVCKVTGNTPLEFEHLVKTNPGYEQVSQAALARGEASKQQ